LEDFTNRTYKDKTTTASNIPDMNLVLETRKLMGDKPVVVVVNVSKPMVFAEIEPAADDFAFGLNWSGVISDERVSKYR
jgi:beta-glucosidase